MPARPNCSQPRGSVLLAVLALCGALGCTPDPNGSGGDPSAESTLDSTADPRPWIVLIVIDTLRADFVGTYGFEGDITPQIDALARESIVFEQAYSGAPWTKPSIASLFTSLHPEAHGVLDHKGRFDDSERTRHVVDALAPEAETLAEVLSATGYSTSAIVTNHWIQNELGFGQGFDEFLLPKPRTGDAVVAETRRWLTRVDRERPAFLYLHLMDAHGPYSAAAEDLKAVEAMAGTGKERRLTPAEARAIVWYLRDSPWVAGKPGRSLARWRAAYGAGVHAADRYVGEVLAALRADGLLDHAVVIVTSDHGEELADHGGWDHGYDLYEEQLRVPLLIRLPGGDGGGRRIQRPAALLDIMPTLLGLAGARTEAPLMGRDLRAELNGPTTDEITPAILATGVKSRTGLHAIRSGRYKLLLDEDSQEARLYDLVDDPGERHNLAADLPEVRADLEQRLAALRTANGRHSLGNPRLVPLAPDVIEGLRQLGYIDAAEPPSVAPKY